MEGAKKTHSMPSRSSRCQSIHNHRLPCQGWSKAQRASLCKGDNFTREFSPPLGTVHSRFLCQCCQFSGMPPGWHYEVECFSCSCCHPGPGRDLRIFDLQLQSRVNALSLAIHGKKAITNHQPPCQYSNELFGAEYLYT